MSDPVIEFEGVEKRFRIRGVRGRQTMVALTDFSLSFAEAPARVVAVAGESGSGKTTAANLALGFLTPSAGQVRYRGRDVSSLRRRDRTAFRRDVQAITQDPYAAFNPAYGVRHVFDVVVRNFDIGENRADARRRVHEALEFVGLEPGRILSSFPHQLSGGERQRVMVARAFLLRPRLIVADEPVSMVDASIRATILELMMRLKTEVGVSFLYITHDLSTTYWVADELLVLQHGEVVERGDAQAVIDNPQHPYVKLLISSIPVPDPDERWQTPLEI
jgi:peptide/nickel transport system ATP-binding protein